MNNNFDGEDDILFMSQTPYYHWLSNFHPAAIPIKIQGQMFTFSNAETAYQYAKTQERTVENVAPWLNLPGREAKYKGKTIKVRPDWEENKLDVMRLILARKFSYNPVLRNKLEATGTTRLIHLAPWDLYWGVNEKRQGQNQLGIILMEIRELNGFDVPSWACK